MFDLLKISPDAASERAESLAGSLAASGGTDLLKTALGVISRRLDKSPGRYLDYGPYWWALRALLVDAGHLDEAGDDTMIRSEYTGRTPIETVVMADLFREHTLSGSAVGTRAWRLSSARTERYTLFDPSMEERRIP
jgi:hypothetical protein